jgi:hypothetical protein
VYAKTELGCTASAADAGTVTVMPDFDPGEIENIEYTTCAGGYSYPMFNVQDATGDAGSITYQWQVNGQEIPGATDADYYPAKAHSDYAGAHTFTRWAINSECPQTPKQSAGSFELTVYINDIDPGAIESGAATTTRGTNPNITINNVTSASGDHGYIQYQWQRTGTNGTGWPGFLEESLAIGDINANFDTPGTFIFTRIAAYSSCEGQPAEASGSFTLTVEPIETPPGSDSSIILVVGDMIWSSPIIDPTCPSGSWTSSSLTPVCANYNGLTYYNYAYFDSHLRQMCPSPWRAPNLLDVETSVEGHRSREYDAWSFGERVNNAYWGFVHHTGVLLNESSLVMHTWVIDDGVDRGQGFCWVTYRYPEPYSDLYRTNGALFFCVRNAGN